MALLHVLKMEEGDDAALFMWLGKFGCVDLLEQQRRPRLSC
jgi:hypothetical protein